MLSAYCISALCLSPLKDALACIVAKSATSGSLSGMWGCESGKGGTTSEWISFDAVGSSPSLSSSLSLSMRQQGKQRSGSTGSNLFPWGGGVPLNNALPSTSSSTSISPNYRAMQSLVSNDNPKNISPSSFFGLQCHQKSSSMSVDDGGFESVNIISKGLSDVEEEIIAAKITSRG